MKLSPIATFLAALLTLARNVAPANHGISGQFDQTVSEITRAESPIGIRFGCMDVGRSDYSIGAWNGEKLRVLTRGFTPGIVEPALRPGATAVLNGIRTSSSCALPRSRTCSAVTDNSSVGPST